MSGDGGVTLSVREYVDQAVAHERQMRRAETKAHDRAMHLQAAEYERRLEALNNSHALATAEQARTVPHTVFDTYKQDQQIKLDVAFKAAIMKAEEVRDLTSAKTEELRKLIDVERARGDKLEGSIASWKMIAAVIGVPGLIAFVIAVLNFVRAGR